MGEETGDRRMGRRLTVQGWFHVVLALMVLMVVGGSVVGARLLEETSDVTDRLAEDGVLVWHIPLPGAVREELDLVRRGDELAVAAGPFRRTVPLPSALRRCTVDGAALRDGTLAVRFAPDPELWPRGR